MMLPKSLTILICEMLSFVDLLRLGMTRKVIAVAVREAKLQVELKKDAVVPTTCALWNWKIRALKIRFTELCISPNQ